MTEPKLSICIPHYDRTELLQYAIASCLEQTVPVRIIVADQLQTDQTKALMARYRDHPNIRHVPSPATSLWRNWKFALEQADTPYCAWLQDDDVVLMGYAARVIRAFEEFPDALHFQSRCHCASPDRIHAVWDGVNGPQCGLNFRYGGQERWPGGYLLASMFMTAWALSPGVAFRRGDELTLALDGMPDEGCDLFAERLILAALGAQGPWVADPTIAGYWVQHGKNEHHKQNTDGSMPKQIGIFIKHLDSILDGYPTWGDHFYRWLLTRSPQAIVAWLKSDDYKDSRHCDELRNVLVRSLEGRAVAIPPQDPDAPEPCVIYEDAA